MGAIRRKTIRLELELDIKIEGKLSDAIDRLNSIQEKHSNNWETISVCYNNLACNYEIIGERKETEIEYVARIDREEQDLADFKKRKIDRLKEQIARLEEEDK